MQMGANAGIRAACGAILACLALAAPAQDFGKPDMGKLTATGGVSQLEGAGGGGLTPWALITGYGTRDSYGANAHLTLVRTQDYALQSAGVAVGLFDRVELSLANQRFTGSVAPLDALDVRQDIAGIKVKVAGDAVYPQDSALPQLALGVQFKRNKGVRGLGALGVSNVKQLGAADDSGVDYYLAATKLCLAHSLVLNGTLRMTKANQMGLLGFGGDLHDRYRAMFEGSAAYLLNRKTVIGLEYRMKPHNLAADSETAASDLFLAYFPSKNFSLTAAYADLGEITVYNRRTQRGLYLSLQAGF